MLWVTLDRIQINISERHGKSGSKSKSNAGSIETGHTSSTVTDRNNWGRAWFFRR